MYYNTTNLTGKDLKTAKKKSLSQNEVILNYFKANKGYFTPYQILIRCFNSNTPITSIRRSMTDLTSDNKLVKTNYQSEGKYGRPNYKWTLFDAQMKLFN